jgi:hypothetical protein
MTDYEYIVKQVKFFHYKGWEDGELRKCVDMLPNLSREELTSLYYSRWVKDDKVFRDAVFNTLYKDKVGKREQRIKELDVVALIAEFQDKKSGNVALVRKEMRDRYKAGKDKQLIADAFSHATKSDQQWVKSQIRKEQYGDSNNHNYQMKKPSWK